MPRRPTNPKTMKIGMKYRNTPLSLVPKEYLVKFNMWYRTSSEKSHVRGAFLDVHLKVKEECSKNTAKS